MKKTSMPAVYHEPKRVTIESAKNGFIVEQYTDKGKQCAVAKNPAEAMKMAKKMLGKK